MSKPGSAIAISEDLIKSASGGVFTNENKFETDYILDVTDQFRAAVIYEHYNGKRLSKNIHYTLMQPYRVNKIDAEQVPNPVTNDICVIRFKVPDVIMLNDLFDGFGYIGSPDGVNAFIRIRNRIELSDLYKNMRIFKPERNVYVLTDVDGFVEVHGNIEQDEILTNAVFARPVHVPNFDIDEDRYPINEVMIPRMKEIMTKITMNYMAMTPEDRIADFQSQLSKLKQQIVIK